VKYRCSQSSGFASGTEIFQSRYASLKRYLAKTFVVPLVAMLKQLGPKLNVEMVDARIG
jgi:hypothetical protein